MPIKIWALLAAILMVGCSSSHPKPHGRIIVALTIDWEGAYLSPEGLDALDDLRKELGAAPITHFVSAGYFAKQTPEPNAGETIATAIRPGDELALHLHAWRSLAKASGIEPRLSPSFLTGTDKLLEFEDGDVGFDVDLDAYSVVDLRALLRTSRSLLAQIHHPISTSFRAGGYIGTPKVLQAIREEGFAVDSSATDYRQLEVEADGFLAKRLKAVWPTIDTTSQPYRLKTPSGELLEMPIAAFADYVTAPQMVGMFEAAHARLQKAPERDVVVVLGFHLETAADFSGRIKEAMKKVRARKELADELYYTTIDKAAERVQAAPPSP